jgi:putative NADPH-quinone reductase
MKRILVLDGHPDPDRTRFVHALADAYAEGAAAAGHRLTRIDLATLDIPVLRSAREWEGKPEGDVLRVQSAIAGAEHVVILYPLWLGDVPAALKALLEQVLRPGFAFPEGGRGLDNGLLKGKSARLVVTMGMPSAGYRFFFLAHSLRSLGAQHPQLRGHPPRGLDVVGNVGGIAPKRDAAGWTRSGCSARGAPDQPGGTRAKSQRERPRQRRTSATQARNPSSIALSRQFSFGA